jgi:hypothetical protein
MLDSVADDPTSLTPEQLRQAYEGRLADVIEHLSVDHVAAETGLDRATLAAIVDDESPELTLEQAAAVLGCSSEVRDAETVIAEVRDDLLLGMTTGVLDVDTIAANIDHDLTGQEVQQALEGRTKMTLAQLAAIHKVIADRN